MVNDTDSASTGWSTYSDVITVNNNIPAITGYTPSQTQVYRTNVVVLSVDTNDVEDAESSLTVAVQYLSLIHI